MRRPPCPFSCCSVVSRHGGRPFRWLQRGSPIHLLPSSIAVFLLVLRRLLPSSLSRFAFCIRLNRSTCETLCAWIPVRLHPGCFRSDLRGLLALEVVYCAGEAVLRLHFLSAFDNLVERCWKTVLLCTVSK